MKQVGKRKKWVQKGARDEDEGADCSHPLPTTGEPRLTFCELPGAIGKWGTQHGPERTASVRQGGRDAQKCSQNKGDAGFSLERTLCDMMNSIPKNSNARLAGPHLRIAFEAD